MVQARLADARKERAGRITACKAAAATLAQQAEQVGTASGEPRAVHLAAQLKAKTWDLPALRKLAEGGADATRDALDTLKRLAALTPPNVQAVQAGRESRCGSAPRRWPRCTAPMPRAAWRARSCWNRRWRFMRLTRLRAMSVPCAARPTAWARTGRCSSQQEVDALNAEASAVRAAHQELDAALRAARGLVRESGVLPSPTAGELPSLRDLREAEAQWLKARSIDTPIALADHLESHALDLAEATTRVAAEAAEALSKREDVWRPLSQGLALWLPHAEQFAAVKDHVDQLKEAEDWWKAATEEIRDERFQPIADRAIATWRQLRLQSNVDLGAVELEGTSTRRKVALKVTVDGKDAEALGVMSQGELHSLALSLFLPRATLPDSPFRFICVDDPVQSMDPARVEGLARVLADTAKTRQVVVFTHDDRLTSRRAAARPAGARAHGDASRRFGGGNRRRARPRVVAISTTRGPC